jgi:hypothetical protein
VLYGTGILSVTSNELGYLPISSGVPQESAIIGTIDPGPGSHSGAATVGGHVVFCGGEGNSNERDVKDECWAIPAGQEDEVTTLVELPRLPETRSYLTLAQAGNYLVLTGGLPDGVGDGGEIGDKATWIAPLCPEE